MATVSTSGATINYETFGDRSQPTLLLINGLGSQLINYEQAFCQMFVDQGCHVVVFDNRDVGLSSKTGPPVPDVASNMAKYRSGESVTGVPYTLRDMAGDAFAVLDAVEVEKAHIAGMSMGGMIVQRMAIDRPERVLSMTSIMSTTGSPDVGGATPEAGKVLVTPPPADRDGFIEHTQNSRRITGGTHYSADYWQAQAGKMYDRCFHPVGSAYQISAVASDGDRTAELASLAMPSLVIHGRLDSLIQLSGGEATAAAIGVSVDNPAELLVIDSMGHDLPEPIWEEVVSAMTAIAAKAA